MARRWRARTVIDQGEHFAPRIESHWVHQKEKHPKACFSFFSSVLCYT